MKLIQKTVLTMLALTTFGCATIVNDANIPISFSFSNGANGDCSFNNKRGYWQTSVPGTTMIRRSDDSLIYRCKLDDGREVGGAIASEIEGEKLGASVLFFDLGITDAITDKHRKYQGNIVIPVPAQEKPDQEESEATSPI